MTNGERVRRRLVPRRLRRRALLAGFAAGPAALLGRASIDMAAAAPAAAASAGAARERRQMTGDPLPSWNDGPARQAIFDFVAAVSEEGGDRFVPAADRIATFDNDGTLWVEQPIYAQGFFALDQVAAMAADHPEWTTEQPFAAILASDQAAISEFTERDIAAILAATHAGITTDAFDKAARAWLATAKHPHFDQRFVDCVYQPQLELLDFLRANAFQNFIVSGGGIDFLRDFAEETYGVPPSQVVGSSGQVKFEIHDDTPVLIKLPQIGSIDDKAGKPVNIHLHIGQKPILAFGNSDGDQQMLEYVDSGDGPRLMLLVHHDDAAREFAYDRTAAVGRLDAALDEAGRRGWTVVSMKDDWGRIFPFTT